MREIKFRAKKKNRKKKYQKWVYGNLYTDIEDCFIMYRLKNGDIEFESCIKETIGQFTGLYDKNNTPIFEGDIVSYNDFTSVYEYEITGSIIYSQDCTFEIEYDDKYIKFKKSTRPLVCNEHPIFASKKLEVIGNIYDNEVEE